MPRNMSFMRVQCQGLKQGEKVKRLCQIRVKSVELEHLTALVNTPYGTLEARKEGFPDLTGREFAKMFCENMGCDATQLVTRIEFEYL